MSRFYQFVALALFSMVQVASAHPGPPGHTHDDEWPFGQVAILAVCLFAGAGMLVASLKAIRCKS